MSGAVAGVGLLRPGASAHTDVGQPVSLAGTEFDLTIGETLMDFTGSPRPAVTVNGSLPAPTLHWREGDTVTLRVTNALGENTSIHWHGILLPANMDGVPGLSFNGIRPGETHTYRFVARQAGTYWYHSHSGFQEQRGLYGALVIEPRTAEPFSCDRDYVVMLSDWTDEDPDRVFAKLKKQAHYYNNNRRTLGDFARDVREEGFRPTVADRLAWGEMRMTPTDLVDVTGTTYTYLMNGISPAGNWTGLFQPGENVRLRFVNAGAASYFDVRIPGLPMRVVAADGQYVHPLTVDEFRIASGETLDVLVEPRGQDAFTIFAQSMDRTGYARGTLAARDGLQAPVPNLDSVPLPTMADMGHASMAHREHAGMVMDTSMQAHPASERGNPLVDMQVMSPTARLDDPGIGLRENGRRVLSYANLRTLFADPDGREPGRTVELHLTGHMERFVWSFDGVKFSDAEPLRVTYGERMRIVLVNDTMMAHPIHLHGMWSDIEDDSGQFHLRKHVVDMPPGTRRSFRVRADALGRWAFHCHLLYHMAAGMFREVRVDV